MQQVTEVFLDVRLPAVSLPAAGRQPIPVGIRLVDRAGRTLVSRQDLPLLPQAVRRPMPRTGMAQAQTFPVQKPAILRGQSSVLQANGADNTRLTPILVGRAGVGEAAWRTSPVSFGLRVWSRAWYFTSPCITGPMAFRCPFRPTLPLPFSSAPWQAIWGPGHHGPASVALWAEKNRLTTRPQHLSGGHSRWADHMKTRTPAGQWCGRRLVHRARRVLR